MFNKVFASPKVVNSNGFLLSRRLFSFSFICSVHLANSIPFLHAIKIFSFHELLDFRELHVAIYVSLVTSWHAQMVNSTLLWISWRSLWFSSCLTTCPNQPPIVNLNPSLKEYVPIKYFLSDIWLSDYILYIFYLMHKALMDMANCGFCSF